MRRIVRVAGITLFVGLAIAGPAVAGPQQVKLEANQFKPKAVQVTPGTKVVWKDVEPDDRPHTVTAHPGQSESFDSHPNCLPVCMGQGDTFEHTFNKAGTFTYYCKVHGEGGDPNCAGMCGKVVVKQPAAGGGGPPATQAAAPAQTQAPAAQNAPGSNTVTATPTPTITPSAAPADSPTPSPIATVLATEETSGGGGRGVLIGLAIAAAVASGAGAFAWSRFARVRT